MLIPTRPSAFDIEQTALCVELCENHSKPYAFVLNHAPPGTKLTKTSTKFLQQNGGSVIDAPITYRTSYMAATTVGKSAPEVEKGDVARREIEALWVADNKLVAERVA